MTMNSFKDLSKKKLQNPPKPKKVPHGELFKKEHGFSLTLSKLIKKAGLNPFDKESHTKYKAIRKARKKAQLKAKQAKHSLSVAFKRTNGKSKTKGNKKAAPKKEAA